MFGDRMTSKFGIGGEAHMGGVVRLIVSLVIGHHGNGPEHDYVQDRVAGLIRTGYRDFDSSLVSRKSATRFKLELAWVWTVLNRWVTH